MEGDRITEISSTDWITLRNKYLINWPQHCLGYYSIDNYIKWIRRNPQINDLAFYALNGDWMDGTFAIIDRYQLIINTLSECNERLIKLLLLLEWNKGLKISGYRNKHRPAVIEVFRRLNLKYINETECVMYYMARSVGKEIDIEVIPGIELRPLSKENAVIADNNWSNKHNGSLFLLKRLINWNFNIGAFDEKNELIAWCFRLQPGVLGALFVRDEFRGKGLGSMVTKKMVKLLSDHGEDTFAFVNMSNSQSRKMFEKLSFQEFDVVYWLVMDIQWKDE